jgi:hypothetical protein
MHALLLLGAASADAQIINTLRGWSEDEPGWSGELAAAIAVAQGNTEYFEFDLSAAAQYWQDRHRVRGLASSARRTASDVEVAEATLLHLRYNYRLKFGEFRGERRLTSREIPHLRVGRQSQASQPIQRIVERLGLAHRVAQSLRLDLAAQGSQQLPDLRRSLALTRGIVLGEKRGVDKVISHRAARGGKRCHERMRPKGFEPLAS